jgi:DNA alkylation repair enzyme
MLQEVKEIQQKLLSSGKTTHVEFTHRIVPGSEKIYGVKTPVLNAIAAKYRSGSFDLAEKLWESGALEEKIIAIKIIEKTGKLDPSKSIRPFETIRKEHR